MDRRTTAVISLALVLLVALWWLLRPPDTTVEMPDVSIPDLERAPPVPTAVARPAEDPGAADWRDVTCLLPVEPAAHTSAHVLVQPTPGADPVWSWGSVNEVALTFRAPGPDGAGLVTIPGYERAGLIWFTDADGEQDCYFPQDPAPVELGKLRVPAPATLGRGVRYQICGKGVTGDDDAQGWIEIEAPPGTCDITVCVTSEYRTYPCTNLFDIEVQAGETTVVDLSLPPLPDDFEFELTREAEGLHLRYHGDGVTTQRLIVGVDGLEAADLTPEEFEALVDEAGVVEIEIANADGTTRTAEFSLPQTR